MAGAEAQERLWWRAVNALREAETLAELKAISGPADAPPGAGDETSWVDDWAKRGREALRKARDWAESEKRSARERAARIADRVRSGVRAIWRASPVSKANQALKALADAANTITLATAIGTTVLTIGLLWLGWRLLQARRQ